MGAGGLAWRDKLGTEEGGRAHAKAERWDAEPMFRAERGYGWRYEVQAVCKGFSMPD